MLTKPAAGTTAAASANEPLATDTPPPLHRRWAPQGSASSSPLSTMLDEDGQGISVQGWRVRATKAPIIGDAQVEAASRALGGVLTVPEILFGNSSLELTHAASGVTLSFGALDALRAWRTEDLPPLKVTVAQQWQAARREEIQRQQAVVLEYDWTYTTPYQGTVKRTLSPAAAAAAAEAQHGSDGQQQLEICTSLGAQPQSPTAAAQAHEAANMAATATMTAASPHATAAALPHGSKSSGSQSSAALPTWQPTQRQADRALLLSRDEPILFFAEVPLYESELDDNGCSQLVAKVRVMPRCWLVLLRFWLRVDGSLVRLRETRLFCR